jgi:hypothetical protein
MLSPTELLRQGRPQFDPEQVRQLMPHLAYTRDEIEWAGHRQLRTTNIPNPGRSFHTQFIKQIDEGLASLFGRKLGTDNSSNRISAVLADRSRHVTASNVIRQDELLGTGAHRASQMIAFSFVAHVPNEPSKIILDSSISEEV